ncbi:uncharacterized protein ACLA_052590 [Aspergillus clavatus NRRL 1]|uniref:F-box domain protein n=1 Tax=Aspergillus clavatus (strain ATCC 1007 / CBS 513.65 / DSM 816 / NCTC 3887 / NRRL 1 / QM 1276 / 107) TaxID=344612 RepID=A1CIT1_ASPCL|nr:uncharacterized protein ACLA_052590 [Aspergillus clavatus NRRL 1]EAW10786.1 conserved hypothetical protein [Aspergillus clavatus NRRL 1]
MVVFIDYDRDVFNKDRFPDPHGSAFQPYLQPEKPVLSKLNAASSGLPSHDAGMVTDDGHRADPVYEASQPSEDQVTPNRNGFSAALSCYPVVKEIARQVDLNTLHALSRTCRQFHANLAPYRHQLVKQTLRCENEYVETLADLLDGGTPIPESVKSVLRLVSQGTRGPGRLVRGKVGKCARDMVGECRRCSRVVCRNCTIKPPSRTMLKTRVRRLCTPCRTAPLAAHLTWYPSTSPSLDRESPLDLSQFTAPAFMHSPCTCEDNIWLCYPCGQTLRNSDTTYRRVWSWRTRYSSYLGGLGTGIGEGCQGVKCGREEECLAAQDIELEVECEADEASPLGTPHNHPGHANLSSHNNFLRDPSAERHTDHDEEKPGYFRQEIIGIGGRVKQKAKKRVTVGACVVEYEDERDTDQFLTREEQRTNRSWCGWCWRVIPSKDDLA